ncbi:hypothetical protein [Mycoplana rhizolycopersici]|uniref:Uncharacterized protein n=1 Tax=Mycoplana rhizolycopersici TaxID=2746702 RepID=A0ABX2QGE4_9HYPH|nr:hypothetical protein [Rhizobium rhizolycopersici]NVP56293.1 hypothetical protein [Rhizobium rhizolycopersici]
MNTSMMELKVNAIRCDVGLSVAEKIMRLERLRNAAFAIRSTDGASRHAIEYGWCQDVHLVEIELKKLSS